MALGLVPVLGFTAVCYASPAAWVLADLFLARALLRGDGGAPGPDYR